MQTASLTLFLLLCFWDAWCCIHPRGRQCSWRIWGLSAEPAIFFFTWDRTYVTYVRPSRLQVNNGPHHPSPFSETVWQRHRSNTISLWIHLHQKFFCIAIESWHLLVFINSDCLPTNCCWLVHRFFSLFMNHVVHNVWGIYYKLAPLKQKKYSRHYQNIPPRDENFEESLHRFFSFS